MNANALEVYLIGRPQSGKTTAFQALVGDREPGTRRVTPVPDPRLDRLFEIFQPAKQTSADIIFVDVFAERVAEAAGRAGEAFTTALGEADMLAIVVRCFGDSDADGSPLDPNGALDEVILELVVADHGTVERRLERLEKELKRGRKEAADEQALLLRCREQLERERPLFELDLSDADAKLLRGFQFLTMKPAIVIANVGEEAAGEGAPPALADYAAERGFRSVGFCAQIEAEIAGLDEDERTAFLEDYGIEQAARDQVIRACYDTLNLISFLTAGGPQEVRAWPIPRGTSAAGAAGTIHTDFERGFIRAEVVAFDELSARGSFAACREAGVLRLEGRDYPVKDGDVITFRFNV